MPLVLCTQATGCREKHPIKTITENAALEIAPRIIAQPDSIATPDGMVWVSGIQFTQEQQLLIYWLYRAKNPHIL
ncbi:hypothetical protein [Leeuwenhoekiella sp. MAR_2009_132]|uniref:hypothetical protein n=1 Tax=Leeuwenhoekiella sp. MAR_2009_132 TaxID=1392489 RepID=UPI00048FBFED|nr:hypothetical protein [Leeuwenhoekiella sp. MAR_2009_132]